MNWSLGKGTGDRGRSSGRVTGDRRRGTGDRSQNSGSGRGDRGQQVPGCRGTRGERGVPRQSAATATRTPPASPRRRTRVCTLAHGLRCWPCPEEGARSRLRDPGEGTGDRGEGMGTPPLPPAHPGGGLAAMPRQGQHGGPRAARSDVAGGPLVTLPSRCPARPAAR